ncbi:adenylyl-sulfate kinase [Ilumatobacter sp.]|uniref:adenylyl-sulfate kinase n=1 Tax=Ilumatobacter sp. TaxID=1967498 RepID=UPI003B529132
MDDVDRPGAPRSRDIVRAESLVTARDRRDLLGHGPLTVWFTGLSGSGKSTLALEVERRLIASGRLAHVLDGDNVRFGLNRDLGFSPADRTENIRRIGEVCRLLHDAGVIVLSAFISPFVADRAAVRALHPPGGFLEVFVDAPVEVCEERDVKGLYARARTGEIPEFSGISAPYEAPSDPDLRIDTVTGTTRECVASVIAAVLERV